MPETNSLVSMISGFFSSAISLLVYLAVSYGLYNMAQALRMKYPVLAWIPYCQTYTLGAVADEHCNRNEGKATTYRKKLLGWLIAMAAMAILLVVLLIVYIVVLIVNGLSIGDSADTVKIPEADMNAFMAAMPVLVVLLVSLLIFLAIYIVYMVYYYISLHKVFKLFAPENATAYLLLSLFVPLACPILFLVLSKKPPVFTDIVKNTADEGQNYYSL